ncbi:response regulator [Sinorhizobium meliloti]|nr:response regulator [Sinorhizobium meliloti]
MFGHTMVMIGAGHAVRIGSRKASLGGKSGIELLHRLRAFGINLSVIFITAVEDEGLELEAVKAGCVAFLHKPF